MGAWHFGRRPPDRQRAGATGAEKPRRAVALIAQRKSDLDFTRTDYDRGKMLIEHGNIPQQVVDQRRNKFEAAEAAYVAANAKRDEADAAIKAAEAEVERLQAVLVDLVL